MTVFLVYAVSDGVGGPTNFIGKFCIGSDVEGGDPSALKPPRRQLL